MKKKDKKYYEELRKKDIEYVWHPYTDIDSFEEKNFPIIKSGNGCILEDFRGNKFLDVISSWWCVNFGHSNKRLINSIKEQVDKIQHVILGGMSNESVVKLSEELSKITPEGLKRCFFASDGSSAVEAALRIAIQYWQNISETKKTKFVSLEDGYHGDTIGAISVGYVEKFHKELKDYIPKQHLKAKSPHCAKCPYNKHPSTCSVECFSSMEQIVEKESKNIIGVIVEPICQGAAGIRIYKKEYLQKLEKLCKKHRILLIADEIAVGFGRTGEMFACQFAGIKPDIIILGKGLTGGYLPMSAVVTTEEIYNSFRNGKTFFYGHTFSGNPIVSNLALEALKMYNDMNILEEIKPKIKKVEEFTKKLSVLYKNSFFQSCGMIFSCEISEVDGSYKSALKIAEKCIERGILVRPMGSSIYLWPPLVISEEEILFAFDSMEQSFKEVMS